MRFLCTPGECIQALVQSDSRHEAASAREADGCTERWRSTYVGRRKNLNGISCLPQVIDRWLCGTGYVVPLLLMTSVSHMPASSPPAGVASPCWPLMLQAAELRMIDVLGDVAVCFALLLVTTKSFAVVWCLAFGRQAYRLFDVRIPAARQIKEWAVILEPGQNLIPYFLALVYMSVLGFTALYIGIAVVDAKAFAVLGSRSTITWLYFSITTIATIGDSRIAPSTLGAQVAVIAQLATGPLLLSWLIAQATPLSEGSAVQSGDR